MDLKEEKYITILAKYGNISIAADKLFISQPALSMYVKKIEKILGVKLFDRSGKKFVLTPAGELYVQKAKKMLRLDEEFHAGLNDFNNNMSGKLSIGIESSLSPQVLSQLLPAFHKKYANVKIDIHEMLNSSLEEMQKKHSCTFYIMHLNNLSSEFHCDCYFQDQLLLLMSKESRLTRYLQSNNKEDLYPYIDLKVCRNELFILPKTIQNIRRQLDIIFEEENIYPSETVEIRMFDCAAALVSENMGICFVRESYLKQLHLKKPIISCIFSTPQLRQNNIYICYLKDHILTDYEKYALTILKSCYPFQ